MTLLGADEADLAVLGEFGRRLEDAPEDPRTEWRRTARPEQLMPDGDWRTWYVQGGRGAGKTRTGAQALADIILSDTEPDGQFGIISPTYRDAWTVCVESESGILRALGTTAGEIKHGTSRLVEYAHRSYGEVGLRNGHVIYVDSADDGALRVQGKNLRAAWCIVASTPIECRDATKPISDVRPGDEVRTRYGWRRVLAAQCTGRSVPVVEIGTSSGTGLRCTPDHRIWVHGRGWVQACHLNPGDRLYLAPLPGTSSTAGGITASRPATTSPVTAGSPRGSTSPSGSRSTAAPCGPGTWSTTSTITTRTTTPATSPRCPTPTMTATTAADSSDPLNRWPGCGRESRNPGSSASRTSSSASSAGTNSRLAPSSRMSGAAPSDAPTCYDGTNAARLHSGPGCAHAISAVGSSPRRTAGRTSAPATAQTLSCVTSVRPSGRADVYDLTVEDAHEFFAAGILVHNCDEIGLWLKWKTAWDESLKYAVRKGTSKIIATGTPKVSRPARALIRRLIRGEEPGTIVRRLRTVDNAANLSEAFYASVIGAAKGTRLERQELEGELLDDVANALWTRDILEACQVPALGADGGPHYLFGAVIGVDPSDGGEESDEQSYCLVGRGSPDDPHVYLAESWGGQESPVKFARRVILKAVEYGARIVVEKNHGGAWLTATFDQVMRELDKAGRIPESRKPRVETVHASQAKRTRAEPVAALYERGIVKHAGGPFVELEDQMATFTGGAGERSPDRLDAATWALTPFLRLSYGPPDRSGVRKWAGSQELADIAATEDSQMRRRLRGAHGGAYDQQTPEDAPWSIDGFAPEDDSQAHPENGRRGNVRAWRLGASDLLSCTKVVQ